MTPSAVLVFKVEKDDWMVVEVFVLSECFFLSCFTERKTFKFDLVDQLNWTLFKTMRSVRYHFTPTAATYKAVGLESGRPKVNSNFIQFFPLSVLFDLNVKLMRRAVLCLASRDVRGCFHKIIS